MPLRVAFGGVALACSALVLSPACRTKPEHAPAPRMVLSSVQADLGEIEHGKTLAYRFRIANQGDAPLVFGGLDGDGDCRLEAAAMGPLAPGATGEVVILCESQTYGKYRSSASLRSNAAEAPELELRATILPRLAFERPTLELATTFGSPVTKEMSIVGTRSASAKLAILPFEAEDVRAELVSSSDGSSKKLRLALSGKRVGTGVGQVTLKSDTDPAAITLHYNTRVAGTLRVEPTNPYFNLRDPAAHRQRITVDSTQPGFRVTGVKVTEGPFMASFQRSPSEPGRYEVEVRVAADRIDPEERGVSGRLSIASNDRSEPSRELKLFALGAPAP